MKVVGKIEIKNDFAYLVDAAGSWSIGDTIVKLNAADGNAMVTKEWVLNAIPPSDNFANADLTIPVLTPRTHDFNGNLVTFDKAELLIKGNGNTSDDVPFEVTNGTNTVLKVQGDGVVFSRGRGNINTNTAFGEDVFKVGMTGTFNIALGQEILKEVTSGQGNVGVGRNILNLLTIGATNYIFGNDSANKITSANFNIGIGGNVLTELVSQNYNVAIGYNALNKTTSFANVSVGSGSGVNITGGYYNSLFGHDAGLSLTSGHTNLFLGQNSGTGVQTGQGNVIIGTDATQPSGLNNSVVIGRGAVATADNQLVIGSSGTPVGAVTDTFDPFVQSHRMTVKINGVDYWIALDRVAP